jgi:hypothetical protein
MLLRGVNGIASHNTNEGGRQMSTSNCVFESGTSGGGCFVAEESTLGLSRRYAKRILYNGPGLYYKMATWNG